jgi:class I fructose-bisphosphate aldolase
MSTDTDTGNDAGTDAGTDTRAGSRPRSRTRSRTRTDVAAVLGPDADTLLGHTCSGVRPDSLHRPGPDFIDRVWVGSDRGPAVLRNLAALRDHGRLAGTGYLSVLPVDQGVEHSGAASFAPNPAYFDPDNVLRLAVEGGCNAVASTLGVLGAVSRTYAHRIPFVLKLNPNELLTLPAVHDQTMVASVRQAFDLGAVAVGATVYWGADVARRELQEVAAAFAEAHSLGLVTILWCYLRNPLFIRDGVDYHTAADLTGQANHLGATLEADLVKQKLPETDGGFTALSFGTTSPLLEERYVPHHPIDRCRWQVLNCYAGRVGLINSGGPSSGASDLHDAVRTAVVNKRAGGTGMIAGRKVFQRPLEEGIALLHAIQDVYLDPSIDLA